MIVYHLDSSEWLSKLMEDHASVQSRTLVLNQGIAGIVYCFLDVKKNICYMDEFFTSTYKEKEVNQISKEEIHAQIYYKMQLEQVERNRA